MDGAEDFRIYGYCKEGLIFTNLVDFDMMYGHEMIQKDMKKHGGFW